MQAAALDFLRGVESQEVGDPNLPWSSFGGRTYLNFNEELMSDLEITIAAQGMSRAEWQIPRGMSGTIYAFDALTLGTMEMLAPYGQFDRFLSGSIQHSGGFVLNWPGGSSQATGFMLRPQAAKERALALVDGSGLVLFELETPRVMLDAEVSTIKVVEMDMRISEPLAQLYGEPRLAGQPVGTAAFESELSIPMGAATHAPEGGICAGRPIWPPAATVDVGYTALSVSYVGRRSDGSGGYEARFAPSSSLINLADDATGADVPWHAKFSGPEDPYGVAQHPYLVWSMFRVMDGRMEQVGRSGIKHAWLTVNSGCTNCGSNNILWPQCRDTYGVGNNEYGGDLGPRIALESNTGIWEESPSFFDPGGTGSQTNNSGTWENRLIVNESELGLAGAEYIFEAWYLARDDINIFNTMGYAGITLLFQSNAWLVSTGALELGPAINSWLTGGANEQTVDLSQRYGHLQADVKVTELGGGNYHYEYALSNFDYDPQIRSFAVGLPSGVTAQNVGFSGPQGHYDGVNYRYAAAQWNVTQVGSDLMFAATSPEEWLDWGGLYNFYFDAAAAPIAGEIQMETGESSGIISATILAPALSLDTIFAGDFE